MILSLQTGIQVTLRAVDLDARMPLTLRDAMGNAYAQAGAAHAQAAGRHLAHQMGPDHQPRPDQSDETRSLLAAGRTLDISLLRRGLVTPTLPDLLAMYGGDEREPDLGLGSDYGTLTDALRTLSGLRVPSAEDLALATVFLREWGVTLDAMGKRYGVRPSSCLPAGADIPERDRVGLDLGIYYWARGEDALDEAWRKNNERLRG